jgi:hypothetical protein
MPKKQKQDKKKTTAHSLHPLKTKQNKIKTERIPQQSSWISIPLSSVRYKEYAAEKGRRRQRGEARLGLVLRKKQKTKNKTEKDKIPPMQSEKKKNT